MTCVFCLSRRYKMIPVMLIPDLTGVGFSGNGARQGAGQRVDSSPPLSFYDQPSRPREVTRAERNASGKLSGPSVEGAHAHKLDGVPPQTEMEERGVFASLFQKGPGRGSKSAAGAVFCSLGCYEPFSRPLSLLHPIIKCPPQPDRPRPKVIGKKRGSG
jgi:hypothetical protein